MGWIVSIDQQITEALADLQGLLADGSPVSDAIATVAREHKLKPEVVAARGRKAFGDLTEVKAREEARSAPVRQQAKIDQAIRDFEIAYKRGEDPDWQSWLATRRDLQMTDDELINAQQRLFHVRTLLLLDEVIAAKPLT